MNKIFIFSVVHNWNDNRVFHKEAISLSKKYKVDLYAIADFKKKTINENLTVFGLKAPTTRLLRFKLWFYILKKALSTKANVYHFHDPELIPISLILKLFGKKIIYDVHEDYITSMLQKKYLPKIVRPIFAGIIFFIEFLAKYFFTIIIAEKYYIKRFPNSVQILNYPKKWNKKILKHNAHQKSENYFLLYTGGITEDRGALIYANLLNHINNIEIYCVGICEKELAKKMQKIAGQHANRLHIEGIDHRVPFERILEYYNMKHWLAGIAIFPKTKHYYQKELTKFFEYMQAGLPIIASNFPVWKSLIEKNNVGITTNPDDINQIKNSINLLINNKKLCHTMVHNGQQLIENKFNWENEEKKLFSLYEKVMKK